VAPKKSTAASADPPSRFWQKINLMAEIATLTHKRPPDRETFTAVLELINTILPFDGASLYLTNDRSDRLKEVASAGKRVDLVSFLTIGSGPGLTGWTATSRKPVLLSDRQLGDEFEPENSFRTIMSVPLLLADDVIGVLNLGCHRARAYDKQDVRLMTIVADQCAVSIERQIYQSEIEQKNAALSEAHQKLTAERTRTIDGARLQALVDLAISINNEINNPLSVIVGNLQCLMAESEIPTQRMLSRLRRIESAAEQIAEVNRRLLAFDEIPLAEWSAGNREPVKV
jgi:signal transduction protein with GAF and PtsI domain